MSKDSPLSRAVHGAGFIQMQGTVDSERFVIGRERKAPTFKEDSTLGFDRFRVSWRDASLDEAFVEHVKTKLPTSLDETSGFDRSANFTGDPHGFLNFHYDAVTALGISMCRAGENQTFFAGNDIYSQFRQLDFEGASGTIRIAPDTGTRLYSTIAFVVWNVRILGMNDKGYSVIEYVPSFRFEDDTWIEIPGNAYEFADGTTNIPNPLPPVDFGYNYIGRSSRAVAYTLMGIIAFSSVASMFWTWHHRHSHAVDSAQPLFLVSVSVGTLIMVSAVIPLAFDETVASSMETLNRACMGVPWLYFLGFSISLSGLLAKMEAVHQVLSLLRLSQFSRWA
jgi:7 transmembrane sweet-taste receptor of 3 GCPR